MTGLFSARQSAHSMLRFRVFHFRIVGVSFLPVFSDRENLGRSGQRERQRGMCSGAHGKRATPIGYKLSRGKAFFRPVLWHGDPFHRYLRDIPAWRRGHLSALWHGDPQLKHFWGRVACRRKGNRYHCRAYGQVCDRVWHGTHGYR